MKNIVSERFALAWSELEWSRDCGLADSDEGRLDDWRRSLQVTVGGKRSGRRCVDWLAVGGGVVASYTICCCILQHSDAAEADDDRDNSDANYAEHSRLYFNIQMISSRRKLSF